MKSDTLLVPLLRQLRKKSCETFFIGDDVSWLNYRLMFLHLSLIFVVFIVVFMFFVLPFVHSF